MSREIQLLELYSHQNDKATQQNGDKQFSHQFSRQQQIE